jgi:hypothetical protein
MRDRSAYFREYYEKNKEKKREQRARYYEANREKILEYGRQHREQNKIAVLKYGSSPKRLQTNLLARERWRKKQEQEAGRPRPTECEVCGRGMGSTLHFDHSHQTGLFRGWLCSNCNRVLGLVDEKITILLELALYLEKSETEMIQRKGVV